MEMRSFGKVLANLLSCITYSWISPAIHKGRGLKESHVPNIDQPYRANHLPVIQCSSASLASLIVGLCGPKLLLSGILRIGYSVVRLANPLVLGLLLRSLSRPDVLTSASLSLLALVLTLVSSFMFQYHFYLESMGGLVLRTALVSEMYAKSLRISSDAKQMSETVLSLVSTNVYKLENFVQHIHHVWLAPFQIVTSLIVLIGMVGYSALYGFVMLVFVSLVQNGLGRLMASIRQQMLLSTDLRVKTLKQVLEGIQSVKLHVLETMFFDKISVQRRQELDKLVWINILKIANESVSAFGSMAALWVTITIHTQTGGILSAETLFPTFSLFTSLKTPLRLFARTLFKFREAQVSLDHIQWFMNLPEHQPRSIGCNFTEPLIIRNGWFSWKKTSEFVLENINLEVEKGQLVGIIGAAGSGKSLLISSILGEAYHLRGILEVNGSLAHCPQSLWIQTGSLKENITFGEPFDHARFWMTVKFCGLDKDLGGAIDWESTHIGERGVTLSGGQKQRINLARAMYKDADIVLLDDPLSELDNETAEWVFDHCIDGPLMKHRTRLVVLHQPRFLHRFHKIFRLSSHS